METLGTGAGVWNPVVWIVALIFAGLVAYWIRSKGETSYKEGTEQTKPFLSGEKAPPSDLMQVKSPNIYWGLTEALKDYFEPLKRNHTGIINDYMGWFMVVLAIGLIVVAIT